LKKVNEVVLETGNTHFLAGRYETAPDCFQEAYKMSNDMADEICDNTSSYCLEYIGHCMFNLGDFAKAWPNYKKAIEKRPNETTDEINQRRLSHLYRKFGLCLYHSDPTTEAIPKLEMAKDIYSEIDDPETVSAAK